jgi:hypothetical protein
LSDNEDMENTIVVFNKNATKLVTQAISNARIEATNEYLMKFARQDLGVFRDSLDTYLTEEQYVKVKHDILHFFLIL